jgi:long-chain fatty acid transport protein
MKLIPKWLIRILALSMVMPTAAYATNAMVLIGYGTKSRGAGGIAIASPQDSLAAATNPATLGFVKSRVDVGADFFFPKAESVLGGKEDGSEYDKYLMPAMGGVYNFNRKISMGFTAVPFAGGGTRYDYNLYNASSGSNPNITMGVELLSMQMAPSVSYKINKQNSVAASLLIGIQRFRAFGLEYFENFTATGLGSTGLTGNGNDYSYGAGARIGWMGQYLKKRLSLGAVYSSKVYMTEFDDYDELFAEQGDLDTPPNAGLGISYKFTDDLTIGFDVLKTFYSKVRSVSNVSAQKGPGSVFPNGNEKHRLGNDDGLGFGWDDQIAYKLGILYDYNEKLTLRAGWNYAKSPVNEKNGEILMAIVAPAITQNHATIGATYSPDKRTEWSFSFVHAFEYEQEGPTFIGNTGTIRMHQNSLGVSFGYKL